MPFSISAPTARAAKTLKRSLALAWKLTDPAAMAYLLGRTIGGRRPLPVGDTALHHTPDLVATALYQAWIRRYDRGVRALTAAASSRAGRTPSSPWLTILSTSDGVDAAALERSLVSVLAQSGDGWRLALLTAGATTRYPPGLATLLQSEARLQRVELEGPSAPPVAEIVRTEYFTWLEPGDLLAERALDEIERCLTREPAATLVYSDEDCLDGRGCRYAPRFKPDWNPELQAQTDYVGDLTVCRTRRALDSGVTSVCTNRAEWRELLRLTLRSSPASRPIHVPRVLYHRRSGAIVRSVERAPRVSIPEPAPLVTLIVPTRNRRDLLQRCLESLVESTDYPRFELLVVDHDSDDPATRRYLERLAGQSNSEVLRFSGPFNFSAINNLAAARARGELLGLLNNDLEFVHRGWLREMTGLALRSDVGAVGAKLLYPNSTVQHGGVLLGGGSDAEPVAGHLFHGLPRDHPGYCSRALAVQEVGAVTAACMVLRREVFEQVGGFDEVHLPVAFNDVDLCLRIRDRGWRILWTPFAEIIHLESASRGSDLVPAARARFASEVSWMRQRWQTELERDPFYNPNLDPARCDFALAFPPRTGAPIVSGADR